MSSKKNRSATTEHHRKPSVVQQLADENKKTVEDNGVNNTVVTTEEVEDNFEMENEDTVEANEVPEVPTTETTSPTVMAEEDDLEKETIAVLDKLVAAELADKENLKKIAADKDKVRDVLVAFGIPVPPDDEEVLAMTKPKASVMHAPGKKRGPNKGTGKSLWDILSEYMTENNYVDPHYVQGSVLERVARENEYSTANNLLSAKAKTGELVKGERGYYALPR